MFLILCCYFTRLKAREINCTRNLENICHIALGIMRQLVKILAINYFWKEFSSEMFDKVLNTPLYIIKTLTTSYSSSQVYICRSSDIIRRLPKVFLRQCSNCINYSLTKRTFFSCHYVKLSQGHLKDSSYWNLVNLSCVEVKTK